MSNNDPMGLSPNSVRLVSVERPFVGEQACSSCGAQLDGRPFWRVRAWVVHNLEDRHDRGEVYVEHACSESCARKIYEGFCVEVSLATGKRVGVQRVHAPKIQDDSA